MSQSKQLANTAVSAVAPKQIPRRAVLFGAVPMFEGQLDAAGVIAEADEFDTTLDRNPEFRELFSYDPLGLCLIEEHDEIVMARQSVEAQSQKPSLAVIGVRLTALWPSVRIGPAMPRCLNSSSVRGWIAMARGWACGSGRRSMIRHGTPKRARSIAAASPVGPAPTTITDEVAF
jgi:hypothetical protein